MKLNKNIIIASVLVFAAILLRIVNVETGFWLNFSMIGAISLFSGAVIKDRKFAYMIPLAFYLLTDLYIQYFTNLPGFYGVSQFFTYAAMAAIVLLGSQMKTIKPLNVLGFSIGGSLIFWIVSNFGVWFGNLFSNFEPGLTLVGTFVRAIPFLQTGAESAYATELFLGTILGDVVFNGVLFGAFALITRKSVAVQAA